MGHAVAPRVTKVPEVRKGDTVLVLAGKDAGKRGTVFQVDRPSAPGASPGWSWRASTSPSGTPSRASG